MAEHWRQIAENWQALLVVSQAPRFNLSQIVGAVAIGLMGAFVGTYNTTRDLTLEIRHLSERMVMIAAEVKTMQEAARVHAERNAERITRLEVQMEAFAPNGHTLPKGMTGMSGMGMGSRK